MSELVRYDAMCLAIAACHDVDEVRELHNKARALEVYAHQALNLDAERKAREVRLRAERRTGELLAELKRSTAPNPAGRNQHASVAPNDAEQPPASEYAEALDRTGISTQSASRYQALAKVPAADFELALSDPETPPTTSGILRAANGATRMDDASMWLWGRLRDVERDALLDRPASEVFGGMTASMQDDARRILPRFVQWLGELGATT